MAYQLIAVDMDGTLLNSQKEITPRTEAAVTAALARGYHVVMTTGRCYRQIVPYMAQFPAMRYAITSSGAAVADCAQDRIISAQNLPADVAAELVRAFEGLDGFPRRSTARSCSMTRSTSAWTLMWTISNPTARPARTWSGAFSQRPIPWRSWIFTLSIPPSAPSTSRVCRMCAPGSSRARVRVCRSTPSAPIRGAGCRRCAAA